MNPRDYSRFRFSGYVVETSQQVISSNSFLFQFRNLGDGSVFINGIELLPVGSVFSEFVESFIDGERSYGEYDIVFRGGTIKKLQVIEKYPVL